MRHDACGTVHILVVTPVFMQTLTSWLHAIIKQASSATEQPRSNQMTYKERNLQNENIGIVSRYKG